MNKRILRQISGLALVGAAVFSLSACTPMAGSSPGYYNGPARNSDLIFNDTSPEEVRYAITRDMYNQGYYLAYDGNPLVFERPMAGYRDMERVSFWLEVDNYGTRVIVDQMYLVYSGQGWRESRDWNDPGRPLFMFQYMFDFHDRYYRQPSGYWRHERERERNRDWSRRDMRQRWEHERRPALPPARTEPPRHRETPTSPRAGQPDPDRRQMQMRDMKQQFQQKQQNPTRQQQEVSPQQQQGQPPKTQQMRDLQKNWRQDHPQPQGQSSEQPQAVPQQPQLQQYRQQMERRQQEQLQQQEQLKQQEQLRQLDQMQRKEQMQQRIHQMQENKMRQQQQPEAPQAQPQSQKQHSPQPDQPQAQPSGPSQKQLDEIREKWIKGQQPH